MEQAVLTVKEAAAILRISTTMLYRLIREGQIPSISLGQRRVIPAAKLRQWIDETTKGG